MKKRILTIAALLFLAIMIPLTVNAATISAEPQNMEVGEEVTVTVEIDTADVESVQFDLKFDNAKYEYVIDSATSDLDSTRSNLMAVDTVRVSAYNIDGTDSTEKVTLKFKAINSGTSVPFTVLGGSLEVVDTNATVSIETFTTPSVTVAKITGKPVNSDSPYTRPDGSKIPTFDNTGDSNSRSVKKSIAGIYTTYTNLTGKIVPYALPTSDSVITIDDLKAEFGNTIDVTAITGTIVKTGDTFTLPNGDKCTVLIYGDVNKDGKVTTADAFLARKDELGTISSLTDIQKEAYKVSTKTEQSILIQDFVLNLRYTKTGTILEAYPVEFLASDITVTPNKTAILRGEKTLVATISANNNRAISTELVSITQPANVTLELIDNNNTVEVYTTSNNTNAFDLTPVLKGNNIENGTITKDVQSITVEEVKTATEIALFDAETNEQITDTVYIRPNDFVDLKVKYYHTYPDGTKVELSSENTESYYFCSTSVKLNLDNATSILSIENVNVDPNNRYSSLKSGDNNGSLGTQDFIDGIRLVSLADNNLQGTGNVTLDISNNASLSNTSGYKAHLIKNLNVEILPKAATDIKIDGTVGKTSHSINLYTTKQNNNIQAQSPNQGYSEYYTLIDVSLLLGSKERKISKGLCTVGTTTNESLTNSADSIILYQNSDPEASLDIDVQYFIKDANGNYNNVSSWNSATLIDAIGISYYIDDESVIAPLEQQGLTLLYGGTTDSSGNVTKKSVSINVKCVKEATNSSSSAPSAPSNDGTNDSNDNSLNNGFNPPDKDYIENLSTKAATVQQDEQDGETEVDVTPSTEPSESPEATESTTPDTTSTPSVPTTPETVVTPEVTDKPVVPELDNTSEIDE